MTGEHLGCFQLFLLLLLLWCLYEYSSMCFLVYRLRIYYVYVVVDIILFLPWKTYGFIWVQWLALYLRVECWIIKLLAQVVIPFTFPLVGREFLSPYVCQHLILSYFYIFAHMVHVELFHCYFNLYFTS